jgi:serine/threonine protein kinase/WD40 repeat protein
MNKSPACPSLDELRQFALREGEERPRAQVAEHIRRCDACLAMVGKIQEAGDLLGNMRRDIRSAQQLTEEPAVRIDRSDISPRNQADDPLATSDYATERPGVKIGPYKLLEQIGEGGFGVVFMAEQQHPVRRKVALKVIKPGMDTKQVVARFEAERQALALMEHPNIARVLDGGATPSGRPFFVMELVRGQPITRFCDQARATTHERLSLFVDVCQAVQHAHQKGIIHRDLKPSNVLVTLHGDTPVVKVIDFGVAKATGEQLTDKTLFTGFAQFVGTPLYMSPEQAALSGLDIDTRSDVYSLGVLLYELLTGTTPLNPEQIRKAAIDEVRRLICDEEPQRPSTRISSLGDTATEISSRRKTEPDKLRQMLRSELDWIVLKALEKDRTRRYDTVNGLAADVRRYLGDEPVSACPPSTTYRLSKAVRRHRRALVAIGVVLAAILSGLVGTTWQAVRATLAEADLTIERDTARNQKEEAEANFNRAERAEKQLREQLWQSYYDQAQARRWSGRPGRRTESLEAIRKAAKIRPSLALRNEAIAAMALTDLQVSRSWPGFQGGMQEVASIFFHPDLELYSRSDHYGTTSVRRVVDDHEVVRLQGPKLSSVTQLFSPDGRYLAVNYHPRRNLNVSTTLILWRIPEGEKVCELNQKMMYRALDFSPDGQVLAVGERDRTVRFYSTKDGQEASKAMEVGRIPGILRFDPSGKRIAIGSFQQSHIDIRDVASGDVTATIPIANLKIQGGIQDLAWHPRGDVLAVSAGPYFTLWNARNGVLQQSVNAYPLTTIDHLAFSRKGDFLATMTWNGQMALWDTLRYGQVLQVPLVMHHAWGQRFQFSRDDQELAYDLRSPDVRVWKLVKGRECLQLFGTGKRQAAIHPHGRLAAVTDDVGVRLWDMENMQSLVQQGTFSQGVRFHPDGSALIVVRGGSLERWPLTFTGTADQLKLQFGPPETLIRGNCTNVSLSHDGTSMAVASRLDGHCTLVDWLDPSQQQQFKHHPAMVCAEISPNGQWVVTSTWKGAGIKIWNRITAEVHLELPNQNGNAIPAFSPDGRWLAISDDTGVRLWNVSDWSPGPRIESSIPGALTFSPDSRLLAHNTNGLLKLYAVPAMEEIATLTPPNENSFEGMSFSADGSQLAVSALGVLQVWDLRTIRSGLAELGLDWDLPGYPHPRPIDRRPIEITVVTPPPSPN